MLLELGDVFCDQGEWTKAATAYARSLALAEGKNPEASACLEDVQADASTWQEHLGQLLRSANDEGDPAAKARKLLRASRVARRFAPDEAEDMLSRAYASYAADRQVAALYEGILVDGGRAEALEQAQRQILQLSSNRRARASLAIAFGTRWVLRHQNLEIGARFLEEALRIDADSEGAFLFLREAYGKKAGDWDRVLTIAEEAAIRAEDSHNPFLLAQAGTIAWRQLGNLIRARLSFERLSAVAPEHPQLRAFEAQIGEAIKPVRSVRPNDGIGQSVPEAAVTSAKEVREEVVAAPPPDVVTPRAPEAVESRAASEATPSPAIEALAPPPPAAPPPPPPVDEAKIAELKQQAEKQETAKRYNEYVKTLLQLAGLVPDPAEKVSLYTKAADLYVSKFANQAEAVKAYESVLAIDPQNAQAVDYLRQMYEKRRDWEKLLGLQRREAERLAPGPGRAAKFLEIAKLATERVKKPEVCIDLWQEVLVQRRIERRGARSARRPLRARQGLREAGGRPRTPGGDDVRPRRQDPGPGEARDDLRRAPEQRRRRRQRLARPSDPRPERPPRAGRAQEEVPRARPVGRPRGLLRRERQMGRVHPRPRAARGQGDEREREDLAPLQDRGALGRQEAKAGSRREGVREDPRARRGQSPGGRGADSDLRRGQQLQGAGERHRG